MQKQVPLVIFLVISLCSSIYTSNDAEARGMPAVNMNLIPTAETLGKGGYSLSVGTLPFNVDRKTIEPMNIDVGGFFKERHHVRVQSDIWLIPTRITYGISERLDLTFGGTYSIGDTEKSVTDYYEMGGINKERVYPQVVLDGIMGMKYNIQKSGDRLPGISAGGEVQMGYTVDDELVDETLEDSFPFLAMLIYMSASYDFELINVHGGLGMFLSSKSIQSNKRFELPIHVGAEIPFDGFAAVVDANLFQAFSGVGLNNIVSAGLRYDVSSRTTLNISVASVGGLIVRLTVGGRKPEVPAPPPAPTLF